MYDKKKAYAGQDNGILFLHPAPDTKFKDIEPLLKSGWSFPDLRNGGVMLKKKKVE